MRVLDRADQPLPELHGLGVRIVDAERAHAAADPELEDAPHLLPERRRRLALEVHRIDVLIFLQRVLGVLDRAVGPMEEPLRMLADPGMIRRALDREIERDLEPELPRRLDEAVEILEGAEVGMHGGIAAVGAADRPRASRIARCRLEGVVAALAVRESDRVDRR